MMHEQKKLGKIVEELTMFFFSIGANDSTARIRLEGKKAIITFASNYELEHEHKLESMERYLKCGRNDGLEDTYWELAGAGDPGEGSQLLLIGTMVDSVEVHIAKNTVNINLIKELN
ncbi:hypothetical protein ACTQ6A_01040 [Lachnospiraceae bacterium LCP25S3_G4]